MPVGIDFDNTIVSYDRVFAAAARERGWVANDFHGGKKQLRDAVRLLEDGEIKWQILQGEVYGARMSEAEPFPGVMEFIGAARQRGIDVFIVSHKTQYSNHDVRKIDLREAALAWMESNGFFDPRRFGFSRHQIFFAETRAEKIARISALGCDLFIDDLEEVFADPSFPANVKRVLFSADHVPSGDAAIVVRDSWPAIAHYVLENTNGAVGPFDGIVEVAALLAGAPVRSVESARPGGNNRLFRIATDDGQVYALKSYPRQASDPRDRLSTEFQALQFMHRYDLSQVPRAVATDREAGFGLYEWIAGEPAQPSMATIDAAIAFIQALHKLDSAPDAASIGPASEACFSARSIVDQVEARFAMLQARASACPDLHGFLAAEFEPAAAHVIAYARMVYERAGLDFDAPIAAELRCLSASDFGFHNALARADGGIVFLDFEYFGWDDPVKLASDFVLHPGMDLTTELKKRFLNKISKLFQADATFAARLQALLPLYALRWTMILLNEFLPERWARRILAGRGGDRSLVLQTQLDKARKMLRRAEIGGAVT